MSYDAEKDRVIVENLSSTVKETQDAQDRLDQNIK